MNTKSFFALCLALGAIAVTTMATAHQEAETAPAAGHRPDPYTVVGPKNYVTDYAAMNDDGTVNVVVEIPSGTNAKWEVSKADGVLRWEFKNGAPRVVKYLPYPGNYGMVPRTLLPKELGGDGDPLDVIVLGPAEPRGAIVKVHLIGVLKLLDGGEQDDKLLAIQDGGPLGEVKDIADLDGRFPGVTTIVETWFQSYKGPGVMESKGLAGPEVAREVLVAAAEAFEDAEGK